jgi:MFS family permease
MADPVSDKDIEESLGWEAAQRPRAGLAALASGVLLFATFLYSLVAFSDSPSVVLTDGVRDVLGQPLADGRRGLLTESAMWFDDNGVELILVTALSALGTVLIAFVLGYLFRAVQLRRPETSRLLLYAALIGPILYGLGPLISAVSAVVSAGDYVSEGRFSTLGAHDALRTGNGIAVAQGFVGVGQLATAVALVLISLNAMRVGLLTRFLGVLGCIVGALLILPALFGPPAIVQSFFLVALGLLFLGRVRAVPPAWESGRAEPWPSQQVLRERKEQEARVAGRGTEPAAAKGEPTGGSTAVALDEEPADAGHPASKKKKRKRR